MILTGVTICRRLWSRNVRYECYNCAYNNDFVRLNVASSATQLLQNPFRPRRRRLDEISLFEVFRSSSADLLRNSLAVGRRCDSTNRVEARYWSAACECRHQETAADNSDRRWLLAGRAGRRFWFRNFLSQLQRRFFALAFESRQSQV